LTVCPPYAGLDDVVRNPNYSVRSKELMMLDEVTRCGICKDPMVEMQPCTYCEGEFIHQWCMPDEEIDDDGFNMANIREILKGI
jgi:hypothetical protein